ncbi:MULTISPECIES: beta-glucoside-specific PTS transporter subunit IIABC [unclassified Exiguobacterium]|uniref:beta-glucoside-specific PTS transporter subunit IIABC n=1 Tax=unclassified Exiguobacterium TaxID=2644629 RepID=UPI000648D4DB|nr:MULTISPECIES: beta-glucoside-specific PTS transporter subunit IIABC [unclassified Exiguobacterium]AOT00823.1 PTS beta-glucoside transporter subunit IIABC [Exiguobacterium sp. U13-1]
MKYDQLAKEIIESVGGEQNVSSLVHCATRLRFVLKDKVKADKLKLEKLEGVIAVKESGGQFQVVVGNTVPEVYQAIGKQTKLMEESTDTSEINEKGNIFGRAIDIISSIFTPLLGVMAGAGILKGLLAIATNAGWLIPTETTYIILNATADSLFYFLPILLAVTSARKFGANQFVAMTVAGALIYPTIIQLKTDAVATTFFGIPVTMMSYTSTVIPIILAVWVMSYVEKFFNRHIHESVKNFVTPLIALITIVPLTLIVFGPIGVTSGDLIAAFILKVLAFNPILAGAFIAGVWQVLVIFGIHWGVVPIFINNIATKGYDYIKPATAPAIFAQAGASFGVMLRSKNKKLKTLAGSTGITALFGITEPAVYGVTLRLKRPFIAAVISAAVGGGIVGHFGSVAVASGPPGLLTLPVFIGDSMTAFYGLLIGVGVSFLLSMVLTYILGFEDDPIEKEAEINVRPSTEMTIPSPVSGQIVSLEKVSDSVFASGAMGQGFAVVPTEGKVVAPVSGQVTAIFASKHAIGIRSEDGMEILIHVGIDTVRLDGTHFELHVTQDQKIEPGDVLITFDMESIQSEGYDIITPVIFTNLSEERQITIDQDQISVSKYNKPAFA